MNKWFAIGVAGWGALLALVVPAWDVWGAAPMFLPFVILWGLLYLFRPPAWPLLILQWATLALLLIMLGLVNLFTNGTPTTLPEVGAAAAWALLLSVPAILLWMLPLLLVRSFMRESGPRPPRDGEVLLD